MYDNNVEFPSFVRGRYPVRFGKEMPTRVMKDENTHDIKRILENNKTTRRQFLFRAFSVLVWSLHAQAVYDYRPCFTLWSCVLVWPWDISITWRSSSTYVSPWSFDFRLWNMSLWAFWRCCAALGCMSYRFIWCLAEDPPITHCPSSLWLWRDFHAKQVGWKFWRLMCDKCVS